MAGIFGLFDFEKPGPGVPEDAPPKPRFFLFFDIYFRKFWNLIKLNLLFFLFNIPAVLVVSYISLVLIQENALVDKNVLGAVRILLSAILLCIPMITVGPAQAGFTYVLRNYSREEHAFIWGDFKEHALKNLKQSLIVSGIDLLVVFLFSVEINMYGAIQINKTLTSIAAGFLIVAFLVFMMMHMFIYPLMVTFKLTIKQIYKNAFIFSMAKLFKNFGILLICFAVIFATFYFIMIGFLLLPLITLATVGMITNFYAYGVIKKYMIDKLEEERTEQGS